jgi:hypothetical protein
MSCLHQKPAQMLELDRQIEAYKKEESKLLKEHPGKTVVFAEGKLQGVYEDAGAATLAAMKRFKPGEFLVRTIGENSLPAKFFPGIA